MQPSKRIWEQDLIKTELKVVCMLLWAESSLLKLDTQFDDNGTVVKDCCLMEMCHSFSIGLCIIPEAAFYIWSFFFFFFIFFCFDRLAESQSEKIFLEFFCLWHAQCKPCISFQCDCRKNRIIQITMNDCLQKINSIKE